MSTLSVTGLVKEFPARSGGIRGKLRAVNDVSFELSSGKTVALVGESGSGKSTVARMIAQLETPTAGTIELDGQKIASAGRALRRYRSAVQMVFQDPFASLNPYHSISHHLRRPLQLNNQATSADGYDEKVLQLLERVNLSPAADFIHRRPHELSGGQRQRVAIARALAPKPRVLIADEPVSMLDVSIRLGVLNLMAQLQREEDLAVLYITHDLATARHFSDEILVMYRGEIVEHGPSDAVILDPQHDYTKRLLTAAPDPGTHPRFAGMRGNS
ncbi:ATP-binding cassette domain-containing protein [Arthrobacter citreus]|jgi:ABC-type glutathione transport system ATPase component|uniref:ATP-binding cassette domain-containing protein n=1 Tax=Arthrobacter citreus TaxID=1670 RepID=A0ABZ2ZXA0_9MICC